MSWNPQPRSALSSLETFYKLKCGYYNYSVKRYFEFCSDKRLRSYSSNKLKINKVRTELFKGTFSIDYHIYGTTCLINSGPLILAYHYLKNNVMSSIKRRASTLTTRMPLGCSDRCNNYFLIRLI